MSLPPPPPPPMTINVETTPVSPNPPLVSSSAPGSFLVNLLIYNGHAFTDHWAYFFQSSKDKELGVKIHATGSARDGFVFVVKRRHDMRHNEDVPVKIVLLQWVDGELFDESAMLGDSNSEEMLDYKPVREFERELYKVSVPGKSLVGIQGSSSLSYTTGIGSGTDGLGYPARRRRKEGNYAEGLPDLDR